MLGIDALYLWVAVHAVSVVVFALLFADDVRNFRAQRDAARDGYEMRRAWRIVAVGTWLRDASRLLSSIIGLVLGLLFLLARISDDRALLMETAEWLPPALVVIRLLTMLEGVSDRHDRNAMRDDKHHRKDD